MQGASPPLISSQEGPNGPPHSDLYVLRTSMRRIAAVALKVYDVWASQADSADLELAEDTVKPLLEQLLRDAGYPSNPTPAGRP